MVFRDNQKKTLITGVVFLVIVVLLAFTGGLTSIKEYSYGLFRHPQSYAAKAAFFLNNIVSYVSEVRNLSAENPRLMAENNSLKVEIVKLKETKRENELLRAVLNLPLVREYSITDAAVIGKDPYFFSNIIIVDRGSDSRIGAGMDVIDSSGFLIGKILEADASISKIRTILDSSSSISAVDQETRVQGIIKNDLSDGLILDMVSQTEKVEINDTIIAFLSGNELALPIAKVILVEKFPNKPFQKIKLSPLADFKNMEKVFIIIK